MSLDELRACGKCGHGQHTHQGTTGWCIGNRNLCGCTGFQWGAKPDKMRLLFERFANPKGKR